MNTYDIRHQLLQADTSALLHRGLPWEGKRYCVVLFNKDLNYAGESLCERSNRLKERATVDTGFLLTNAGAVVSECRSQLLAQLEKVSFPKDRCTLGKHGPRPHSKYGTNKAQFISFGITATRKKREGRATRQASNMNNSKYPQLYAAFCQYMDALAPGMFGPTAQYHACIISKDSQCELHTDQHNIGPATLTTLGDFTGGQFQIEVKLPFRIVIPTYHRVDTFVKRTYNRIIRKYGLEKYVTLLIQDDADEIEYRKACPQLGVLRTPPGLLNTMNYVVSTFPEGERVVCMHDDLTRIFSVDAAGKRHNLDSLEIRIIGMFDQLEAAGCSLGGVYPANMPLSMMKQAESSVGLYFVHDPLHFLINRKLEVRAEGLLADKQDFVRTFIHFERDGRVMRWNWLGIGTSYNSKDSTYGARSPERELESAELVASKYTDYVKAVKVHKNGSTSLSLHRIPPVIKGGESV